MVLYCCWEEPGKSCHPRDIMAMALTRLRLRGSFRTFSGDWYQVGIELRILFLLRVMFYALALFISSVRYSWNETMLIATLSNYCRATKEGKLSTEVRF